MIRHRVEHGMVVREVRADAAACRGTLVYIHGLGESGLAFEGLMRDPRLADRRHLAADMPGYGKTPWRAEPLGLEELAALLADWAEAEIAEPVVVVGHSMGGVIGTFFCERLARRPRGFLNVEGNISLADCGFSSRATACSEEDFLARELGRMLDAVYEDGIEERALRTYYPSMRMCDPRAYRRNSEELVRWSREEGLAPRMAALETPHLYLLGRPRGTGAESRALLDHAGVPWRGIDEAGHWPFLDQPASFLDEMVAFLERLD